jgi:uncharacterized membrane protein YfcA
VALAGGQRRENTVCLITSAIGLAAFAVTGRVAWPVAVILAAGMTPGGLLGQWLTRRTPEDLLRAAVAVVTAFGAGHMAAT